MVEPYLLLVDDNQDDLFLTRRTLQRHGFPTRNLKQVNDGLDALAYLQSAPTLPAVVLINCRLRRLSSEELIQALRDDLRTKQVLILLLTGSAEERQRLCGEQATRPTRADGCLGKPISWPALRASVLALGASDVLKTNAIGTPAYRVSAAY